MHQSVMDFVDSLPKDIFQGKTVLEVGSYNENGTVRDIIEPLARSYLGIDMRAGPGVDACQDVRVLRPYNGAHSWDVVVCCEMLEHCEDWRAAITNMTAVCKSDLILTTRSVGFPYHGYPDDYWRFSVRDMICIFAAWYPLEVQEDQQDPGVFVWARRPKAVVDLSTINVEKAPAKP